MPPNPTMILPFQLFITVVLSNYVVCTAAASAPPPNFIVFFVDDLGYGDLGFTGHPTTSTPHMDRLAHGGNVLTTWYSGCPVCTGSRAALMTGRQFLRTGLPGVMGPSSRIGLPLNETTLAELLRDRAGYRTAACGKWHLGDREVYLPGNRGFDLYLGIPYSDDMGNGRQSTCQTAGTTEATMAAGAGNEKDHYVPMSALEGYPPELLSYPSPLSSRKGAKEVAPDAPPHDPAADTLPLVYQAWGSTTVLEQPVDFTTLTQKYTDFCTTFLRNTTVEQPFFLYVPFSHVHTTHNSQPQRQYAGCDWQNATRRGPFGDALAELDHMVGAIVDAIPAHAVENTLILLTSDNGPWLVQGLSGGSMGLLTGRSSGYWDTGKGTTWEGGIRMPAVAYWKGTIPPHTRTAEPVSSLDVVPTLTALAGISGYEGVWDGKDISDLLLWKQNGTAVSPHQFLFFYGTCDPEYSQAQHGSDWGVAAVRHGPYKAHYCTGPGLSGIGEKKQYRSIPLLFHIEHDPSEAFPLNPNGTMPVDPQVRAALHRIQQAHAMELATFVYGRAVPEPDGPGEGPGRYGQCCDRSKHCVCNVGGWGSVGTKHHHDLYHHLRGEEIPASSILV